MLRWLSFGLLRRYCLYSPRKCFVLLLTVALVVTFSLMWMETSPGTRVATGQLPPAVLNFPSRNLSLYPIFLLPDSFTFRLQPRMHVCGGKIKTIRGAGEARDRFEELLEARPDGEEPEVAPPAPSSGVIFVAVLAEARDIRMTIRRTWGSGGWLRDARCRVIFICGRAPQLDLSLEEEAKLFSDILQIDQEESDAFWPKRFPGGLAWIEQTCSTSIPTFVAKAKPSVFINRHAVVQQIDSLPDGLHGRLNPLNSLDSAFFIVKGAETIETILLTLPRVKYVPVEDGFITDTVADAAGLHRFSSVPFSSLRWRQADGCSLLHNLIYPDLPLSDFMNLWLTMTDESLLDCRRGGGCCQDEWSLVVTLGVVWLVWLLLHLSIVHTFFWSSFTVFCSDVCNTVDSGLEDEEDSDMDMDPDLAPGVALYDLMGDGGGGVRERSQSPTFLFDIHRPYGTLAGVDRY